MTQNYTSSTSRSTHSPIVAGRQEGGAWFTPPPCTPGEVNWERSENVQSAPEYCALPRTAEGDPDCCTIPTTGIFVKKASFFHLLNIWNFQQQQKH